MEFDARRLYLGEGYSSLFVYCTQVLHLAEGAAYNRIEAARAARRFPIIAEALETGSLTVTAVRLLAPHLTVDNHTEVLARAHHNSKSDIERLIAALAPRPPAPTMVRRLVEPGRRATQSTEVRLAPDFSSAPPPAADAVPRLSRPAVVPLAPERYKVQLTISAVTFEKLERVRALVRHAIPNGDVTEIFDRALTLLLSDLERRRCAATVSPRNPRESSSGSRHIPAAVRREVWRRDNGQCAFVGREGRCGERGFLEFHHVRPYAAGGTATVTNIQLRCRSHNAYEASLFFGQEEEGTEAEARDVDIIRQSS